MSSKKLYNSKKDYGPMWVCANHPACDAYVGCHPKTIKPLGRLANPELRSAKIQAHAAFDRLWKAKVARGDCGKSKARGLAYRWLAEQLGIDPTACHIGMFDPAMCLRVVEVCKPYHNARGRLV